MTRRPSRRERNWNTAFLLAAMVCTVVSWFMPDLISGWPVLVLVLYWGHRIDSRDRDWRIEQLESRISQGGIYFDDSGQLIIRNWPAA